MNALPVEDKRSPKAPRAKRGQTDNDIAWQALHMAAAAACRGSTAGGGSGSWTNAVLVRDTTFEKDCNYICGQSSYKNCDAELSIWGSPGKATKNGQEVGMFYNYGCNQPFKYSGGKEATGADDDIKKAPDYFFSYCCCRK